MTKSKQQPPRQAELVLYRCPTCDAKLNQPCVTPAGHRKQSTHDLRPFALKIHFPNSLGIRVEKLLKR